MSFTVSMLSVVGWIWTGLFFLVLGPRLVRALRNPPRGFQVLPLHAASATSGAAKNGVENAAGEAAGDVARDVVSDAR